MNSRLISLTQRTDSLIRHRVEQVRSRLPWIPEAHWPAVGMLALASAIACGLWFLRVLVQQRVHFLFLPWNLFLAWLPLVFAVATLNLRRRLGWRRWKPWLTGAAWLAFFPNAPYIFTDLTHLQATGDHRFWIDMIIILLFAWPGFLVGCLSLRLLHDEVTSQAGMLVGWLFVAVACGLAGTGVYIGRFLRWNTWDILANPLDLGFDLLGFFGHPATHPAYRFAILFGILLFIGYATLHANAREAAPSRRSFKLLN